MNVSRFGPRLAGAGGFINISQNSKAVCFLGTFLAPARTVVRDGRLAVTEGVAAPKFLREVQQRTFSGQYAVRSGQPVLYITDRCVFRLTPDGLRLTEIAPGVDLGRDVLAHLEFEPVIDGEPAPMDARIFADESMGLKDDLLTIPLAARFAHDERRNLFFLNLEGLTIRTADEIDTIAAEVDKRLAAIGRRVRMIVNYDNFAVDPELTDRFRAAVRRMSERYYESVTRYTTSAFLRLKLAGQLTDRGLSPHLHESRQEALSWLDRHGAS